MLTFRQVKRWANNNGWEIEKKGRKYEFWKVDENGVGPTDGIECEEDTLAEAYSVMYHNA